MWYELIIKNHKVHKLIRCHEQEWREIRDSRIQPIKISDVGISNHRIQNILSLTCLKIKEGIENVSEQKETILRRFRLEKKIKLEIKYIKIKTQ